MPDREEIFSTVREILCDALGVDEDEVVPQATLTDDLGAESIDFLDIVFRLEKSFEIKIPRGELFPDNVLSDERFVQDGKITPDGLKELRARMPYADVDKLEANPDIKEMSQVFTVDMICRFIEGKVGVES
ncbi:MAG: acyl carrier protein [Pirellulales bacterium]|nr:acyl carrier protein [Pirellulales bacterium]